MSPASVAGRRPSVPARLVSILASAILAAELLAPVAVTAASGGATGAQTTRPGAVPTAVAAVPAPIGSLDASSGAAAGSAGKPGTSTDPSVGRSPTSWSKGAVPKVKTEVPSKRTRNSRTFASPDGTFTTEVSSAPLNYQDLDGNWVAIDTTLAPDGTGGWLPLATGASTRIPGASGASGIAELEGGLVTVRALGYGAGALDGSRVVFTHPGAPDVFASATDTGAEVGAVFTDRAGPSAAAFTVDAPAGTTAAVEGGAVVLRDAAGVQLARIDPATLLAAGDRTAAAGSPITVTVAPARGGGQPQSAAPSAGPSASPAASPVTSAGPPASGAPSAAPAPSGTAPSASPAAPGDASPAPSEAPGGGSGLGRPPASFEVVYTIDPGLFSDPATPFPITLDPYVCVQRGAGAGCNADTPANNWNSANEYDTYVGSGQPTTYPVNGGSILRAGYDAIPSPDAAWAQLRSLVVFDHYPLPDGALVTNAKLRLRENYNYGNGAGLVYARLEKKPGFGVNPTWSDDAGNVVSGYDSDHVDACASGSSDCYLYLNVTDAVRTSYTNSAQDWHGDYGFEIALDHAGSSYKEVDFYRGTDTSNPGVNRPVLIIYWEVLNTGVDFDPALGDDYAPSRMTVGVPTTLPVVVTNKASSTSTWTACTGATDADCYQAGYRWYDARGKVVAKATADLPAGTSLAPGHSTPPFALGVTPPSTVGSYTLRLDLVHRYYDTAEPNGHTTAYVWASDWASPSLYYSRDKRSPLVTSTRWTGSSKVERDEFGVSVGTGDLAGDPHTVPTGDGGQVGVDLATTNVTYAGDTGLGFADLGAGTGLSYAYHGIDAQQCVGYQGVLGACGWTTPYDERITGGMNRSGYDYTYVDAAGRQFTADTDADGQVTSGAPVLLERPRITVADESKTASAATTLYTSPAPFSGTYSVGVPSSSGGQLGIPNLASAVDINTYSLFNFAVQTSSATRAAVCFRIHDATDAAVPDHWFCYTMGSADWDTTLYQRYIGPQTLAGAWTFKSLSLWYDVHRFYIDPAAYSSYNAAGETLGGFYDEYQVNGIQIKNPSGSTGTTYLDAARFESLDSTIMTDSAGTLGGTAPAQPAWPTGPLAAASDSPFSGATSFNAPAGANYSCTTGNSCWSTSSGSLYSVAFMSWWWRKVGGSTTGVTLYFHDDTTGADINGGVTYYAGPVAPTTSAANHPVQVSPVVPASWSRVTRNVLEDARQILGAYTDADSATATNPQGPHNLRIRGITIWGADGKELHVAAMRLSSLPDAGRWSPVAGVDGTGATVRVPDEFSYPSAASGSTWCGPLARAACLTYDFRATYPDGSVHYFNDAGLLVRIADANGNVTTVSWSQAVDTPGPAGYKLASVRAPSDSAGHAFLPVGASSDAYRALDVTTGTDNSSGWAAAPKTVRFDENLGTRSGSSITSDASSRAAVFDVVAGTKANSWSYTGTVTATGDPSSPDRKYFGPTVFYPAEGSTVTITGTSGGSTGRIVGVSCPEGSYHGASAAGTGSSWPLAAPKGASALGCRAYLLAGATDATLVNPAISWASATGDLVAASPARSATASKAAGTTATGSFCTGYTASPASASGCAGFAYDAVSHRVTKAYDPRYTGSTGAGANYAVSIAYDASNRPQTVTDDANAGAVLFRVWSFANQPTGGLYRRALYQDATMAAAKDPTSGAAAPAVAQEDLLPDGSVKAAYAPQGCSGDCAGVANSDAALNARLLSASLYDGLTRVSSTLAYRCGETAIADPVSGATACRGAGHTRVLVSRSGQNAAAKVDNYADPLAAQQVAWGQSPDQYAASLRDSGGTNPDLYRTETAYDAWHRAVSTRTPALGQNLSYGAVVKDSGPTAYWRMDEASGSSWSSAVGGVALAGKGGLPAAGAATGLVRDAGAAASFDGTDWADAPGTTLSQSAYSIEAWFKATGADAGRGIAGTWGGASTGGALLYLDGSSRLALATAGNSAYYLFSSFVPTAGRWYHVVGAWDGASQYLYVDGALVARQAVTTAPGTGYAGGFEVGTYAGSANYSWTGSIDEVALYNRVLGADEVRAHAEAGHGVISTVGAASYDLAGNQRYAGNEAISNGDLEDGLDGWATNGSVAATPATVHTDATAPFPSQYSAQLTGAASMTQVGRLVPGQAARVQFYDNSFGANPVSYRVQWYNTNAVRHDSTKAPGWTDFTPAINASETLSGTWSGHAWDVTLPADSDGRVRIVFSTSGVLSSYVDDVVLVTSWGTSVYDKYGRVLSASTLPLGASTSNALPLITATTAYGPDTAGAAPALFPVTRVANVVAGGNAADQNATATAAFDAFGHVIYSIDPDLVASGGRDASGNPQAAAVFDANQTDVVTSRDAAGNASTAAYDRVGNKTLVTAPDGSVTSSTYNRMNLAATTALPDGTSTVTSFDGAGQATTVETGRVAATSAAGTVVVTTHDAYGRSVRTDADCPSASIAACGGRDAVTTTAYDLAGSPIAKTTYGGGGTGGARTSVAYTDAVALTASTNLGLGAFGKYGSVYLPSGTDPAGAAISFAEATGTLASTTLTPSSAEGAPPCPDTRAGTSPNFTYTYCNTAAIGKTVAGAAYPATDLSGRPLFAADAYGTVTRAYYDLAGKTVASVAAWSDDGLTGTAAKNVVTTASYTIAGLRSGSSIATSDPADRRAATTAYDALGRAVQSVTYDKSGNPFSDTKTAYTKAGRTDRTSGGAQMTLVGSTWTSTADSARIWTRTAYDSAGRAVKTVSHYDVGGGLGVALSTFESGADSSTFNSAASPWAASGAGASIAVVTTGTVNTGRGALLVTPGSATGTGAAWTIPGTYPATTITARLRVWVPSGSTISAKIGSGTPVASNTTQGWQTLTPSWSAAAGSNPVLLVTTDHTGAANAFRVDDAMVSAAGAPDANVPASETGYDAMGRTVSTALPPGDFSAAGDWPLVTLSGYDAAGRSTITSANADVAYPTLIAGSSPTAYFPLDDSLSTAVTGGTGTPDRSDSGSFPLLRAGTVIGGVAGAVDDGRTGARFVGVAGNLLSRGSAVTTATTNVTMEAWVRRDRSPSATEVVAWNGTSTAGWGIGVNTSGYAVFESSTGGMMTAVATSATLVADGNWHHVVIVHGTGTSASLYVDGGTAVTGSVTLAAPGAGFAVGGQSASTSPFAGDVEEVAVYATALSAGTVQARPAAARGQAPAGLTADPTAWGMTTRTSFDALGRAADAWKANPDTAAGTAPPVRDHVAFDGLGNPTDVFVNYLAITTGPQPAASAHSTYAYDALGEMTSYCTAQAVKDAVCATESWAYAYDALGRQTRTVPPGKTYASLTQLDATETVYDAGGRVSKVCSEPVATTGCADATSGSRWTLTDPSTGYDRLGRVTSSVTEDPSNTSGATDSRITTTTAYNTDGATKSVQVAGSSSATGVYNGAATPNTFTDKTTYAYDTALGRPITVGRVINGTDTPQTSIGYTDTAVAGFGQVASRTDAGAGIGTTSFSYDWAGRLKEVDGPATGTGDRVTQTWRLDGLLATRVLPTTATETDTVTYDAARRPTAVTRSGGGTGSLGRTYNRAGTVATDTRSLTMASCPAWGCSGTASYSYDAMGRLAAESGLDATRTYTYDADGNRLSRQVNSLAATTYTYDRTDQLVKQTDGSTDTYFAYDAFGGMTSKAESASTTSSMEYDAAGLTTSYNVAGTGAIAMAYDALARLATRTLSGTAETYWYAGTTTAIAKVDTGTASTSSVSVLDPSGARLSVSSASPGTSPTWALFDGLGSAAALVSPSGPLAACYRFDGYGNAVNAGAGGVERAKNPYDFTGAINAGTDGQPLYVMGARLYAPSAGSFTSMDTYAGKSADPLSMNRFLYAEGDPTTLVDPSGHNPVPCSSRNLDVCQDSGQAPSDPTTTPSPTATCTRNCTDKARKKDSTKDGPTTTPDKPAQPTVYVVIPTGPVDLTNLAYASDDWYRLVDWCHNGGAEFSPAACQILFDVGPHYSVDVNYLAAGLGDALSVLYLTGSVVETDGGTLPMEEQAATNLEQDLSRVVDSTMASEDATAAAAEDVFAGSGVSWSNKDAATGSGVDRLARDVAVEPRNVPGAKATGTIGLDDAQNTAVQSDAQAAKDLGATDIRINQYQVTKADGHADAGTMVGRNRPDLQFTLNGQRYHIEYDTPSSGRGQGHADRILANDPGAIVFLVTMPLR